MSNAPAAPPQPPPGLMFFGDDIETLLHGSAYLSCAVTPLSDKPNVPIPMPGRPNAQDLAGVQIHGQVQPLSIESGLSQGGRTAPNKVGPRSGSMSTRWQVIPDNAIVHPGVAPPPARYDPNRSQRFAMRNFRLQTGRDGDYIEGFGTGRTYPGLDGTGRVYIAASGKVTVGVGSFAGADATFCVNGHLDGSLGLVGNILVRIINPKPGQVTPQPQERRLNKPGSFGGSSFVTLLGTGDPKEPIQQVVTDGRLVGADVTEIMKLATLTYSAGNQGLQTNVALQDAVAARLKTHLRFDPFNPKTPGTVEAPLPWQTHGTEIAFLGDDGYSIGSISPNIEEGYGFAIALDGFPGPALNLVGYGAFRTGTGAFEGARGIMTVNSAITPFPPKLANLYTFQFIDRVQGL